MRTNSLKPLVLALSLLGFAGNSPAQTVLMNITNAWKYFASDIDGTGWEAPLYDDTAWPGPGRALLFIETAAGVTPRNTPLPPRAGQTIPERVYYFRTHFTFNGDPATVGSLIFSNKVDDGVVVYLNAAEIYRVGMAGAVGDAVDYGVFASRTVGDATTFDVVTVADPALIANLINGDNVLAARVHQVNDTSSDIVWGTSVSANIVGVPVSITTQPTNQTVIEGFPVTFSVGASGSAPIYFQWYQDGNLILDATNATYTIASATSTDAGTYYVVAMNDVPSNATSDNAVLTVIEDTTPPVPVMAVGDCDPNLLTVSFDEEINPATVDTFAVTVHPANDPGANLVVNLATVTNNTNLVLQTAAARDAGVNYAVTMSGIQDRFGNQIPDATTVSVAAQQCFQQDVNGYTGTHDTDIRFAAADITGGARTDFLLVDLSDGTPAGPGHALFRFDGIFGDGPGLIPLGANIVSATLTLYSTTAGANGDRINVYEMLVPWDESTATWNSFVNGVDADGIEAKTNLVDTFLTNFPDPGGNTTQSRTFNVMSTLQSWANGEPNYGWVLLPTGTDGYRIDPSEHATVANHPLLKVAYIVNVGPVQITQQPQASQTVNEGQSVTLFVTVSGPRPQFQWLKDGSPISGATSATLTLAPARPSDAGVYSVVVVNDLPSFEQSQDAQLSVIADLTAPTLVAALAGPNGDTVTLAFSEPLDPNSVSDTSHYSVELPAGSGILSILSATLTNGTNVILSTSPQQANTNYLVRVTGVRDTAQAGNLIAPNSQSTVAVDVNLIPIDAAWKYDATGTDLGTIWLAANLDDVDWTEGPALFGLEPDGTPVPIQTPLALTNAAGTRYVTYYFRKHFTFPYTTAGVELVVHQAIDDGAVFYLNGEEIHRYNMPTNPVIYYTNQAAATVEVGTNLQGPIFLPANLLVTGPNLLAIEVHQSGTASSDVVFGLKLDARVLSFAPGGGGTQAPVIGNGSGGVPAPSINGTTFSLSFASLNGRTYTLQGNTDLSNPNGWIDIPPSVSGNGAMISLQDTAATGTRRFYRVKVQ